MKRAKMIAVACFVVACGGSAAPEASTPSSSGGGNSTSGTAAPDVGPQNAVQNTVPTNDSRGVRMNAARGELDRAESQVGAALSDCATACRALESMERAAEHLCALDSGSECGRARERLEAARQRVRASCGGCR
jgi:hypothetical protein